MEHYEQNYDGYKNIGGWLIPDEEVDTYLEQRKALSDYLLTRLKEHFPAVYEGGAGSQDGDYISVDSSDQDFSVFVHLDPSEVAKFDGFESKEAYFEELIFFSKLEAQYNSIPGKLDLEGQAGSDDWYEYSKTAYEATFNKEYPYERFIY